MRGHAIVTCVAAAVLSSAFAPAAADAQKPTKKDTVVAGGLPGPGGQLELAELMKQLDALRKRVTDLEKEVANGDKSAPKIAAKFQAPFTVVDENGKSIFSVTDDPYSTGFRGRVHISPGSSGNNYNIWMHSANGTLVAAMGESNGAAGLVSVLRDGKDVAMMHGKGFELKSSAGKMLGVLGLDPSNETRARLGVRGVLQIYNESNSSVVDAGMLPDGRGAVRTWPNSDCKSFGGMRSPTCLMGVAP
jgi:hypothetical protein